MTKNKILENLVSDFKEYMEIICNSLADALCPAFYHGFAAVATRNSDLDKEYLPEAIEMRKRFSGILGRIINHHNGHGLCFEMEYYSGSRAFWDPEEIICLWVKKS